MFSVVSIVVKVFGIIAKLAPLLFAYKAGSKSASLKNAKSSLEKGKARTKLDADLGRLSSGDRHNRLQRWLRK
ncbi:hypothetical protein CMI37_24870 [Candidatus Pacearchaeota archaeon]|jgi:hypothetical protein|nr:hypothetical protein [Candidatus Pacearchaeota archaeon]|tara:strand:- start:17 stop:235 length:219 start_codon:yes stop_codon:yes gene_type:complete